MTPREGVQSDAEAGFTGHLRPGAKPALVMVDLVRAYFEPGEQLYMGLDDCIVSAEKVLTAAREAGVLVVHTKVSFVAGGVDGGQFFKKVGALANFVGDTPAGRIMPQVEPLDSEPVLVKQYASAFFGTSLASTLQANGVDTVIIAGVSTSGCIRATAVDALQYGFVPLVVREAVGDRADGPHEANLYDIQAKYGEVMSEADILAYLRSVGS
ncbi:isochorismatase family protein [Herbiconiux sp. P15]|uniref:isochorismatase family protein n=1 Tax=Herbiconiux liukaitaii TaxID=3342799 RepID=UPI0035B7153F